MGLSTPRSIRSIENETRMGKGKLICHFETLNDRQIKQVISFIHTIALKLVTKSRFYVFFFALST